MKNNIHDLASNQYSSELEGTVFAMGVGNYTPFVVPATKILTKDGTPVTTLGVNEVGDCIGIIGWHEKTKAIYIT